MTELLYSQLTGKIIGVYYDVFNGTGRTYPEFIYERAMVMELVRAGVSCKRQPEYPILYKGKLVGEQILDLFVADEVAVEIKAVPELTRLHRAQAISYLKAVGKSVGLLCNFGGSEPKFERLYFHRHNVIVQKEKLRSDDAPDDWLYPELVFDLVSALYEVHGELGPGFIHRIYANAVYRELRLRGIDSRPFREFQVYYREEAIGALKFNHFLVEGKLMLFPVAIQKLTDVGIFNLKAWMRHNRIRIGLLANFYPDSLDFTVLRA